MASKQNENREEALAIAAEIERTIWSINELKKQLRAVNPRQDMRRINEAISSLNDAAHDMELTAHEVEV